ncbi:MAG: ABC transporter permease [Muribaculaceae bacterium]|nr:ABC transporter permease [Muribaculaceae bacterium]MBR3727929.1 ABC transporter permease [Muribaculaceae bacterium]
MNVISIVAVCGIVVATAALICVLSVFNGFRGLIMGKLAMLDPEVAITATMGKTINNADSIIDAVSGIPGVERAVPVIEDQALAMYAQLQMPVRLKGVPDDYNTMNQMDSVIVDGQWKLRDQVSRYAVAGAGPAVRLCVRPDFIGMVRLYAPQRQGHVNIANPMGAFRQDSLFVSGIFQLQQNNYDADLIYVPLDMARDLFDYETEATQVEVKLAAGANEQQAMRAITQALGDGYLVKNRLMQQSEAYRLVNIEKWMAFLLLAFILIIATFNVISTLSLLIIEKDDSIATLRALGANDRQISRIFVLQGWLITLVGAITGVVIGLILCLCQQRFGWLHLSGDPANMIIDAYPVEVQWTDVLVTLALVAAVGLLTSMVTALIMRRRLRNRESKNN